jgi:tryptophan-rich sensory protein
MIQRIQTVYLLLTILISGLFLAGSFLQFRNDTGEFIKITFRGIYRSVGGNGFELAGKLIPLTVVILLIPVISAVAIILYKKRKLQLKAASAIIFMAIVLIILTVYYVFIVISRFNAELVITIKMFLPVVILLFAILAFRAIKKDENLVRSYDRLR